MADNSNTTDNIGHNTTPSSMLVLSSRLNLSQSPRTEAYPNDSYKNRLGVLNQPQSRFCIFSSFYYRCTTNRDNLLSHKLADNASAVRPVGSKWTTVPFASQRFWITKALWPPQRQSFELKIHRNGSVGRPLCQSLLAKFTVLPRTLWLDFVDLDFVDRQGKRETVRVGVKR